MPMKPNTAVWGALFSACRIHGHAKLGGQVASQLLREEPQNGALYTALMNLYNETGKVDEAEKVKRDMKKSACKKNPGCSVIEVSGACTEFIVGDVSHPQVLQVCSNLSRLAEEICKGTMAFISPIASSCCISNPRELRQLHAHILTMGLFQLEVFLRKIITFCAVTDPCSIEYGRRVLAQIDCPSTYVWNTMVRGYASSPQPLKGIIVYNQMLRRGASPDAYTFPFLLKACSNSLSIHKSREIHCRAVKTGFDWNVYVKNSLIHAYSVAACAHLGSLEQGRWVHSYVQNKNRTLDTRFNSALIDMYCKCGSTERAMLVFKLARNKDVTVWTSLISGLASHGFGRTAIQLFEEMKRSGVAPNDLTLVAVLSACTHAGLVQEGLSIFERIRSEFCIQPKIEHYGCMVDLLGRAGLIMEALSLIESMPMEPNAAVWGALFSACRIHGHAKLGGQVASQLLRDEPQNGALYMALMNLYNETGKVDDAEKVKRDMKKSACKKNPGCSVIEVNGACTEFIVGDESHPQALQVCSNLSRLAEEICKATVLV
ncbi:Pentatricopeptide repeat-containing protein [Nymphaea thermarum]|nr:Pentatricopeptide repeat-containing protein [Nymphaea thermarum]